MCGRYALRKSWPQLREQFPWLLDEDEYFDIHGYKIRQEIFPGEYILAINKEHKPEEIFWTIEDHDVRVINARAETIHQKAMFKEAFRHDRVLIPADALFEWQVQPNKKKLRYEMTFDEDLFAFAGIARDSYVRDEKKRCGVIITTRPNEKFKFVHNAKERQAVVIRQADYDAWLDPETPLAELQRMMQPLADEETHYRIAADPQDLPDPDEDRDPPTLFDLRS